MPLALTRSRTSASGKEFFLTSEWAAVLERIAETALPVYTRAACSGRILPVEAVALKEQWPKQLVQHPSLLLGDRGMRIHYIWNSLYDMQRSESLTFRYIQARSRNTASSKELFLAIGWAVVLERIAETVLPVHTSAACTGRIIPVEAVTLKQQWPKQLVQHLYPYEYRNISDTSSSARHWLLGSESSNARRFR